MLGLPIVAYLFLGGAGAGAYLTLSALNVIFSRCEFRGLDPRTLRPTDNPSDARLCRHLLKRGYIASFLLIAAGSICLLCDMGRPENAYMLFTSPTASYITVGSFSILALLLCCTFHAAASVLTLPRLSSAINVALVAFGSASAIVVMGYTGAFLRSVTSVALWNSNWLIALFLLSSLSTGIAVVMLTASGLPTRWLQSNIMTNLAKIDILSIVAEAITCAAHLFSVSRNDLGLSSVHQLVAGEWAIVFIGGFVICGLVLPCLIELTALRKQGLSRTEIAPILVLLGGFCLRLSIFQARLQTVLI